MSPIVGVYVALGSFLLAGILQVAVFAFFLGKLSQKVASLEGRPNPISFEATLMGLTVSLEGVKDGFKSMEERVDQRFRDIEHAVRNKLMGASNK